MHELIGKYIIMDVDLCYSFNTKAPVTPGLRPCYDLAAN